MFFLTVLYYVCQTPNCNEPKSCGFYSNSVVFSVHRLCFVRFLTSVDPVLNEWLWYVHQVDAFVLSAKPTSVSMRQSRKMPFKAVHLNRIGSGEFVWCIVTCDALYVWWLYVSAFLVVYMCSKQHLDPEATVRDHGVGVKMFSKSNQQQCLPEGLFALQHVGICVYRNARDREHVFVNFWHGGGVFLEVGISEF